MNRRQLLTMIAAVTAPPTPRLTVPEPPRQEAREPARPQIAAEPPPAPGGEEPVADAAVTTVPGVVLAILTADCLPVVLAADDGSGIGAAHAGWRGLADGVLEATVAAMHTPAARLRAWLGPAAGPAEYEIGTEVYEAFVGRDRAADAAFSATRPGHWKVDLYALARQRLQAAGLAADSIYGGSHSTIADPDLFSYRRDRRTGRMATLVWLAKGNVGPL